MLFVLEMIMLMVGIRVLLKGTLPSIPFIKPPRDVGKGTMNLLGIVLMLPLPVAIVTSVLLNSLLGDDAGAYDAGLDIVVFAGSLTAVLFILRQIWRPGTAKDGGASSDQDGRDARSGR